MTNEQRCVFDFCGHPLRRHVKDDGGPLWYCQDCHVQGGIAQKPHHEFTTRPPQPTDEQQAERRIAAARSRIHLWAAAGHVSDENARVRLMHEDTAAYRTTIEAPLQAQIARLEAEREETTRPFTAAGFNLWEWRRRALRAEARVRAWDEVRAAATRAIESADARASAAEAQVRALEERLAALTALAADWERMTWVPYSNPATSLRVALAGGRESTHEAGPQP